ncbi:MAG: MCE family protein [Planctomycetes bacterium]|nr:MCE family protein [Planctomycetota bacterium]
MNETKRNLLVALFVLMAITCLGWMVFQFGDLPMLVHRMDAHEISIFFDEAPGIKQNTEVQFLGYPVGRVVSVNAPRLLPKLDKPGEDAYQVVVVVSVATRHQIPKNAAPKIYVRGLGSSYISFDLEEKPVEEMFENNDTVKGLVSTASEFISETTQGQLDKLIDSLYSVSDQIQKQLESLPPEVVDQSDPTEVRANVTTTVMRLDTALKNLNVIIGDPANQQNVKQGLADFNLLVTELRQGVRQIEGFTTEAVQLIEQTSVTVKNLDVVSQEVNKTVQGVAPKIQTAADEMAQSLNQLTELLVRLTQGQGTAGRIVNDPRLYESLVDAVDNMNLTMTELRVQLALWKEHGILYKDK